MRVSTVVSSFATVLAVAIGPALPSEGVELDANILGVYTDTTFTQLDSEFWVSPDGNQAVADLQPGQGVLVGIDVANPNGDLVRSIFTTLRVDGTQITFLNGVANGAILLAPGFGKQPIPAIAPIEVKPNSPGGSDVWVQAMVHHLSSGATGLGPDINAVELYFEVPTVVGPGPIDFVLDLTAGDGIQDGDLILDGAVLYVPEPSVPRALLTGVAALAFAALRRQRM